MPFVLNFAHRLITEQCFVFPVIEHLQRLLQWQKEDTVQTRTVKLQVTLARYRFPQADTLALFAALLSLPLPADTPPLNISPQRQKQKTAEALIAWLVEEAEIRRCTAPGKICTGLIPRP